MLLLIVLYTMCTTANNNRTEYNMIGCKDRALSNDGVFTSTFTEIVYLGSTAKSNEVNIGIRIAFNNLENTNSFADKLYFSHTSLT